MSTSQTRAAGTRQVDAFLCDWRQRHPRSVEQAVAAAEAGRYEYAFSYSSSNDYRGSSTDVVMAEQAYMMQGNNFQGHKTRHDRQSMSTGDAVLVDGLAYMVAVVGFERVPALDAPLGKLIEASWELWTRDEEEVPA